MISYTTAPNHFENARELLAEDDQIEMDIQVEGWSHTLRIRSLTVPQRNKINALAGIGDARDWTAFYVHTLVAGVVQPKFTPSQAQELVEYHNGEPIEELGQAIWGLGSLYKVYAKYRDELKALHAAKDQLPESERD